MLLEEFEKRTGFYPSANMYDAIELVYSKYDGDKDTFCADYKANKNGLAESIQQKATLMAGKAELTLIAISTKKDRTIEELTKEVERLESELEKAQGWKKYGSGSNMSDADYLELEKSGEPISEDRAKDILHNEFGFAKEFIMILNELPDFEKNALGQFRRCGSVSRLPRYEATDWNYIRFDVNGWHYEYVNGDLCFYSE